MAILKLVLFVIIILGIFGFIFCLKKRGYVIDCRLGFPRRGGKERRSGRDRRWELVVGIVEKRKYLKDRRSGKERRSGEDRRRNINPTNDSSQD